MGIKQNVIGRKSEDMVADFFKENHYWAFVIPKGPNGQPFDIVARKGDKTFFVDAKHTDNGVFNFSRIEPNQLTSMSYAYNICNIKNNIGFVVVEGENFYFFHYLDYLRMEKTGQKSVKTSVLTPLLTTLKGDENAS